ncbi:hypothetical protein RP20_CCG028012 [Aedes albopictus]|nr:hypothetical protein RP20_CCG028012 [Aedes albopictus]
MCSLEAAEKLASAHHLKHLIVAEQKSFNIPVYIEDSAINVRIHDLPPAVPNAVVAEHMQQYGKVKSVARELWKKFFPGVPNGVRVVRIELAKHVPSFVRISDHITTVTYRSQIATCRQCQRKAHPGKKCSEDKGGHTVNQQPPIAHNEADNQMDVTSELDQQRDQQKKRSVSSTVASSVKSPPRKKQVTRGIEHDRQTTAAEPIEGNRETDKKEDEIVSHDDSDSDSGPDPSYDDVDAWFVKLRKRTRKQEKRIAELMKS